MSPPWQEGVATVTPATADDVGRRVALPDIESEMLRRALAVWNAKRGARRYPARNEISPRDMAPFLRNVTLYRLTDGDFEYRVMGDAAVQAWGHNFVGYDTGKLNFYVPGMGDVIARICTSVARRGEPLVLRGVLARASHRHIGQESLFLPLGPDERTVDHVLSVAWYTPRPPV